MMKSNRKSGTAVASWMVALVIVLGASAAQAAVIYDSSVARKVIGITNVEIDTVFYNITFAEDLRPIDFYGDPPGTYTFNNVADATLAVEAINLVLNGEDPLPLYVGVEGGATDEGTQEYLVGYRRSEPIGGIGVLNAVVGQNLFLDEWRDNEPLELPVYAGDDRRTFAAFTVVPEPGTALLMGLGLASLGVVGRPKRQETRATT